MSEEVLEWGAMLILSMQGWGDWLIVPMNIFTFAGNDDFYLLVLPAIYWCWDTRLGLRVGLILLMSTGLNAIFKLILHDPRPYWVDSRVRLLTEGDTLFGLPSGHAQNAVAIWGILAARLGTILAWLAAIVLIFFIGVSRAYLGVHYPTDIIAGWIIGAIVLILFLNLEAPVMARFKPLSGPVKVSLIFALSIGLVLSGAFLSANISLNWELPAEWLTNAELQAPDVRITPLSLEVLITSAGALFGLATGAVLIEGRFSFDAGGPWHKRLARYLVGAVGVFILWRGLGFTFDLIAVEESAPGYILRYIRYGLIGGWVSAVGPMVFVRLKLTENRPLLQNAYET